MNRYFFTSTVIFFIITASLFADDPPRSIVTGRVLDTQGQPLPNVEVNLDYVVSTKTGIGGHFYFDVPCPLPSNVLGFSSLLIRPDSHHLKRQLTLGYNGCDYPPLVTGLNDLGNIILEPAGAISGRILFAEANPQFKTSTNCTGTNLFGITSIKCNDICSYGVPKETYLLRVPVGIHTVTVERKGYKTCQRQGVIVCAGETTPDINFTLEWASVIGGRVVDPVGRPLSGIHIRVRPSFNNPTYRGQGAETVSDDQGRFRIPLPHDCPKVRLEASIPGYAQYKESNTAELYPPGKLDIEIRMKRFITASFSVIDGETGAPIERYGMRIILKPEKGAMRSTDFPTNIPFANFTDGIWRTSCIPQIHDYIIEAPGYASQHGALEFSTPKDPKQTIRLWPESKLKGTVLLQGTVPVDGMEVSLQGEPHTQQEPTEDSRIFAYTNRPRTVKTDQEGKFEFAGLSKGAWHLSCHVDGIVPIDRNEIAIESGEIKDLGLLIAEPSIEICGRVLVPDGISLSGFVIALNNLQNIAVTDHMGRFLFRNRRPGAHELIFVGKEYFVEMFGDKSHIECTIDSGGEWVFDLRKCTPFKNRRFRISCG